MKKAKKKSSNVLQYAITVFLALAMMGAFMSSFGSGFFMLLATLVACPFTRNAGINFIKNKCGDKFPIDKIKGGVCAVVVIVFIFIASGLSPKTETADNNQIAQSGAESAQTESLTTEKLDSEESITASIEESIEAKFEQVEVVEESTEPTISTIEESKSNEVVAVSTPIPTVAPTPESTLEAQKPTEGSGAYAVNGKNGKIHIVGKCSATEEGNKNAMKSPVHFNTYEEAESHSIAIAPGEDKRKCGNCW